ncbi:MAG TPA: preprotein translocase subunit SecE [Jatrophihabitantaceae bacterium]
MARDRQRAKQRRRRQADGPRPSSPSRPRRELEEEADPSVSSVFPQRGDVRPVEADEETLDFDETVEPAPDELDPAVTEERVERAHPRRQRGRIITFLGHVVDELRRVQWPDRRHVGQGTAVVLGFVAIAGTYLGLLDALWKPLIEAIL